MSGRWVIDGSNGWLNARAVNINWSDEAGRLGYQGPVLDTGQDAMPTQLRWMINPRIGLPSQPFTVSRRTDPGGLTKQELANLDWEPVETVGLPIDTDWGSYRYSDQGPVGAPLPPYDAALRRLDVGAPRIGWTRFGLGGPTLPDWQPPDHSRFLKSLLRGRLLGGIRTMLANSDGTDQFGFSDDEGTGADTLPSLILDQSVGLGGKGSTSSAWQPLRLLALTAGSDTYAALALGFGTAIDAFSGEEDTMLMVSVPHRLGPDGPDFELADIVWPFRPVRAPGFPTGLTAGLVSHTRPQYLDGPALDSVGVGWQRPPNPSYATVGGDEPYPVSYAVGRFGPAYDAAEWLMTKRDFRDGDGDKKDDGWMPYIPSQTADARPALFPDHLARTTDDGSGSRPDVAAGSVAYAVAAQDLFGRWSGFATVPFDLDPEAAQVPSILAVTLSPAGLLQVDFAWNWSDRRPQFIELTAAFADDPATAVFEAQFVFAGSDDAWQTDAEIVPLDQSMGLAAGWGSPQDADDGEPGTRYYRASGIIDLDFGIRSWRDIAIRGRGQCYLHELAQAGFNVSPFSEPKTARALDPRPPAVPGLPEAPQWTSLPDAAGVAHAQLGWNNVAGAMGYIVYEATETALLSAVGARGPDTAAALTTRLATLRALNLPALRRVFRRVEAELIPSIGAVTRCETPLPRGSRVMHVFAVIAVSENNIESAWPGQSKQFAAFATPRLRIPAPPALEAVLDDTGPRPAIVVTVAATGPVPVDTIEIFRTIGPKAPDGIDAMGQPITRLRPTAGGSTFRDEAGAADWQQAWYRAQSWSGRDDQAGFAEARSGSSGPLSVIAIPAGGLSVDGLAFDDTTYDPAEVFLSWTADVPVGPTPLGSHKAILEITGPAGEARLRLANPVDQIPVSGHSPAFAAQDPQMVRIDRPGGFILGAWIPRSLLAESSLITAKIVDPLGRMADASIVYPPPTVS